MKPTPVQLPILGFTYQLKRGRPLGSKSFIELTGQVVRWNEWKGPEEGGETGGLRIK